MLTLAAETPCGDAAAQVVRDGFYIANGPVVAEVLSGNTLYIGGSFNQVGPPTGGGVPVDSASGIRVSGFPKVTGNIGEVWAVAADGAGGWYIGGRFTAVGDLPRSNLAHIRADNTVSSWNPQISEAQGIYALAVSGAVVYAGGYFNSVSGQPRNNIAALDATTGSVLSWNPNAVGAGYAVFALAVSGSTVYVGGSFTNIGGQPRNGIAALDSSTGLATAWNPNASGSVKALVVSGSKVYAGGSFGNIGGQPRNNIAALDVASNFATTWNPNANGTVNALALSGSTVYAGGVFSNIGGLPRLYIAALDTTGGLATAWNPQPNDLVNALAVSGNTLYAAGRFTSIAGQSRNCLAAFDASSGLVAPWNPSASLEALALAGKGGVVYVGGRFKSVNGQTRHSLAALNATTGALTAWDPSATLGFPGDAWVYALAVGGSTVYAGGNFGQIGGQPHNYLAALDAGTGLAIWNPNVNGPVYALAVNGSTVYAGGDFVNIGGQTRFRLAALYASSGLPTPWNPSANGRPYVLAASGSTVYAGGTFNNIGGQPRNNIAALDTSGTGLATSWNPNANSAVVSLAVSGSTVYAGGGFSSIGSQTRYDIAALDTSSGLATSWNPSATDFVWALAVSGNTVYAGGGFNGIGGQARNRIAALDAGTGLATPWNPDANNLVQALVARNDVVYAGGSFTTIGGKPGGLAAIEGFCPAPSDTGNYSATHAAPEVTVTGDFDGDGRLDIAAAVSTGAQVMRNVGGARFDSLAVQETGGNGRGIAAADFNDDHALDLAVSTSTGVHLLLGQTQNGSPTGGFGPPTHYAVGASPTGMGVADFNEDGITDLAVAVTGVDSVAVLLGQGGSGVGNGSLNLASRHAVGDAPLFLAVSDFNGDGIWDLAVTDSGSAAVSVLLGNAQSPGRGDGTFAPAVNYSVGAAPRPIVTGDFNEDGVADLAVGVPNGVRVLLGHAAGGIGDGTFAAAVSYAFSGSPRDLKLADFDGDGRADLAASLAGAGTLQYLFGDGTSTLGNGRFLVGSAPYVGGYLSSLEVNQFDLLASDPTPIVSQADRNQLVSMLGGCSGGTGRSLGLTSPNGGEAWTLGSEVPIQWARGPLVMAVNVEISRDDGIHWKRIASNLTGTEFDWTVTPPGTTHGRIRVVDAHTFGLSDASNGTFQMQPLVDVPAAGRVVRPSFSLGYPNPARGSVRFDLRLPAAVTVSVEVFDLAGRRTRSLAHGVVSPGEHTLAWDGRNGEGAAAADGIYFVRARMPGYEVVRRVVRIE